ncbi:MAG: hypothetical protein UT30_C0021G0007 [Candidatus Uhrbacteria bacterium GW2011_GWF2_39_13]|uniref:Uncharacterized protein n=1 Tax=Candidatus Uhrbacteria bacterium GW2011_GWF2_39_13 TaxID=1618995 RepID=A0A0G0MKP9_9BACT|nr:MAG: hypothetical protein UT30_C0021G0007 [Candidatus Uhrbacteria bacterium GW2011_GWF2_39_13]
MPPFGGVFEIEGVNPREERGETTKVKMIFNRQLIAALGVNSLQVLFDFLETAFDFPSCGVKHNHLFSGKCQVSADERKCEALIDEYNLDLASEGLGHAEEFGKFHRALLAVDMDFGCSGKSSQLGGKLFYGSEAFAKFGVASAFAGNNQRKLEEPCVDAEPGEKLDRKCGVFPDLLKERSGRKSLLIQLTAISTICSETLSCSLKKA